MLKEKKEELKKQYAELYPNLWIKAKRLIGALAVVLLYFVALIVIYIFLLLLFCI
jgi:flagellar biosynthesis/type III secretory pathway M-ring protein FliF/YscJ